MIRSARSLCYIVLAGAVCASAHGQSVESKKYEPNLLPIRALSEAPPPNALQAETLKSEFVAAGLVVPNDLCTDAIDVGSLPAFVAGTTIDATPDDAGTCGTSNTSPGVWYTVTGTGNNLVASFCIGEGFADYDSKISVFCGGCDDLFCVAGNDDSCGLQSEVSWCSTAGQTYYILVHGFSANTGNFGLLVDDLGTPCDDAVACEDCTIACDPGAIPEGEQTCSDEYDDMFNGGCNSTVPVFSDIACGETVCGTSGTFQVAGGDSRDTDWYRIDLATTQIVTWEVSASFPVLAGIVDNAGIDDCTGVSAFLTSDTADACGTVSVSATLTPGIWWLFVSPSEFTGVDCGSEYQGTVTCADPPTGAVCMPDSTCLDGLTQADADALGGIYQGDGTNCGDITCPLPPENDLCEDAESIPVPSLTFATTSLASVDDAPLCGTSVTSPGVWYRITGTGNTITASLCGPTTGFDSKISVYCGDCDDLTCVDGNDDSCGLQSEVSFCSQEGAEYLILVHGFGGQSGDFELDVYDDGVPCTATVACLPAGACCGALITGGCTHTVEMLDSFGDGWNGATMDVLVNGSPVLTGISASGTGSSETFSADIGDVITTVYTSGSFESENSYTILDGAGNAIGTDGPSPSSGIVSTGYCPPTPDCMVLTEGDCVAAGGVYEGDDTDCGVINYDVDLTFDSVIDITGSGTALGLGDDDGVVVPLGFTFNFYGNDYTDIGVSSNGYLTFGSDLTDFSNDSIPDTNDPNDLMAVMWDDLDPSSGGEIYYETLGAAPNRMFIALWAQVPQFNNADQNTFEAILYEGSNRVEYRYFSITPQAFSGDYTMGVENADGTTGRSIDPDWAGGGGNGFGYNQDPPNDPCNNGADITTQGAAPGDSTYGWGDGIVTAADINFYINAWIAGDLGYADVTTQGAAPGHPLYSAEDGVVTAADINYYVNQWVQRTP